MAKTIPPERTEWIALVALGAIAVAGLGLAIWAIVRERRDRATLQNALQAATATSLAAFAHVQSEIDAVLAASGASVAAVAAQVASLNTQVASLNAEDTTIDAQIAALSANPGGLTVSGVNTFTAGSTYSAFSIPFTLRKGGRVVICTIPEVVLAGEIPFVVVGSDPRPDTGHIPSDQDPTGPAVMWAPADGLVYAIVCRDTSFRRVPARFQVFGDLRFAIDTMPLDTLTTDPAPSTVNNGVDDILPTTLVWVAES